jgi:uncharacterized protein YdeI (YjbR/CyaY-like superfamily)
MSTPAAAGDLPILLFETPEAWAAWLDAHHAKGSGLWLRIAKKRAALRSVTYAEALDVALCYGWIDSLKKSYDADSWIQKFTPRGPKSVWSQINRDKAQALIDAGRMQPPGLLAVTRAQEDGRWAAAYSSQRTAAVPGDLQAALDRDPAARAFFETLDRADRFAVLFRVQTATRPEIRARRIADLVAMLARNEKLHP